MNKTNRTPTQDRWLRFFNETVYEALPAGYNLLDRGTFGIWWRLVRRALDYLPPGGQVLEIGFGPGRLQEALSRRADLCLGLDLAWGMCRFTRRRLGRAGLPSGIVQGSVFALPYRDGAFDSVVSTFAFSGFPRGAAAMAEMARVTARGGQLVLVDIGRPADGNRLGRGLAWLWERMGDYLYNLPELMQGVGLEVSVCEEFGPGKHIRAVVGQKPMNLG